MGDAGFLAVVGNCQAPLWRDALKTLLSNVDVVWCEHVGIGGRTLVNAIDDAVAAQPKWLVLLNEFAKQLESELTGLESFGIETVAVPPIAISGFHPDIAYVHDRQGIMTSARGTHWNSKILYWC